MVYWKIMSYISYCGKSKVGSCWGLQQSTCIQRKHKVFGPARYTYLRSVSSSNCPQPLATNWLEVSRGHQQVSRPFASQVSVKRFRNFLLILLCSILRLHLKKKKNSLESFSIYVISVFCSFLTVLLNLLVDGGTVLMKEENQIRPDSIIIRSHGPLLCSVCCCYYKW